MSETMEKCEGLIVIGAGLPRTGTASLRTALKTLLNSPIYHMFEVIQNGSKDIKFWNQVCTAKKTEEEWHNFFKGQKSQFWTSIQFMLHSVSIVFMIRSLGLIPYNSHLTNSQEYRGGVDFPLALFYRDLIEIYPDAKVILTIRDPEKWYKSVKETIYQSNIDALTLPANILYKICGLDSFPKMVERIMRSDKNRFKSGLYDAISDGKEASIEFYKNWITEVKKTVPQEKLLIFSVKDGWEPLCNFLELPIPEEPFPNSNDSEKMKRTIKIIKIAAYCLVFGLKRNT